jgi:hypothetical protein
MVDGLNGRFLSGVAMAAHGRPPTHTICARVFTAITSRTFSALTSVPGLRQHQPFDLPEVSTRSWPTATALGRHIHIHPPAAGDAAARQGTAPRSLSRDDARLAAAADAVIAKGAYVPQLVLAEAARVLDAANAHPHGSSARR